MPNGGLAHVDCVIQVAESQAEHRGNIALSRCQRCKLNLGAMQMGFAEAFWSRVRDEPAESEDWRYAAHFLAIALVAPGKSVQSEQMQRDSHSGSMRILRAEHPNSGGGVLRPTWPDS